MKNNCKEAHNDKTEPMHMPCKHLTKGDRHCTDIGKIVQIGAPSNLNSWTV